MPRLADGLCIGIGHEWRDAADRLSAGSAPFGRPDRRRLCLVCTPAVDSGFVCGVHGPRAKCVHVVSLTTREVIVPSAAAVRDSLSEVYTSAVELISVYDYFGVAVAVGTSSALGGFVVIAVVVKFERERCRLLSRVFIVNQLPTVVQSRCFVVN